MIDTRVLEQTSIQFKVAAARRMLYREGCDSAIAGHVSVRDNDGATFWVSPFEYFDQTVPSGILRVGMDLKVFGADMHVSPAIEFHAAIYLARPDVMSVVHTHSHYASVLSSARRPAGVYNQDAAIFHDDQALYEEDGTGPLVEGRRICAALGSRRVLLMKNHGVVIASQSLEEATVEAMMFETAARFDIECRAIGGTECTPLQIVEAKRLYRELYMHNMWDANLARLRRSDPDLFDHFDE